MTDFVWPGGAHGAVSLSFDDGMGSQRDVAVPLLDGYGIQATFYVNPQDGYADELATWHGAATAGHEIGNHTVNHPCSQNFAFISESGRRSLESMGWDDMAWEIDETNQRLAEVFPNQGPVSFAYPCYQPFIGRGRERRSYVPLVLDRCVAGRGRGERANDPRYCDLGYLWSFACERMTGAEMIGLVEQSAHEGKWAILTFHGIHEGHLSVAAGDLEALLDYLVRQRSRIWTQPVATAAQWVSERQVAFAD